MELGRRIRRYRDAANMTQEELAERVFVSRQTISNWENDRSYPDIKSLMLMSEIFRVSLDHFIKGDLEKMRMEIDARETAKFERDSAVFGVLFVALLILPVPLAMTLRGLGVAIYVALFGVSMRFVVSIERYKRKYDIQTYREIVAFADGKALDEIEKAREEAKRPYQKVLMAAGSALLVVVIALVLEALWRT